MPGGENMNFKRILSCLLILSVFTGVKVSAYPKTVCAVEKVFYAEDVQVLIARVERFDKSDYSFANKKEAWACGQEIEKVVKKTKKALLKYLKKESLQWNTTGTYQDDIYKGHGELNILMPEGFGKLVGAQSSIMFYLEDNAPVFCATQMCWKPLVASITLVASIIAFDVWVEKGCDDNYHDAFVKIHDAFGQLVEKANIKELAKAAGEKTVAAAKIVKEKGANLAEFVKEKQAQKDEKLREIYSAIAKFVSEKAVPFEKDNAHKAFDGIKKGAIATKDAALVARGNINSFCENNSRNIRRTAFGLGGVVGVVSLVALTFIEDLFYY